MNTQTTKAIIKRMIQPEPPVDHVDIEVNLPIYICNRSFNFEEYLCITKEDAKLRAAKVTFYDGMPWAFHNELPFDGIIQVNARIISYHEFTDAVGQVAQVMENTLIEIEKFHLLPQIKEEA